MTDTYLDHLRRTIAEDQIVPLVDRLNCIEVVNHLEKKFTNLSRYYCMYSSNPNVASLLFDYCVVKFQGGKFYYYKDYLAKKAPTPITFDRLVIAVTAQCVKIIRETRPYATVGLRGDELPQIICDEIGVLNHDL